MKKIIIKTISAALVFVLTIVALSSCGGIGKRKTEGFRDNTYFDEYWWEESYAGCVDGIKRLKSHGSTFIKTIPISYEGELFDMKYCIHSNKLLADREASIFVDRFDRKIENVLVMCFAFFDDADLYDIRRSYLSHYKAYRIIISTEYAEKFGFNYNELTVDLLQCSFIEDYLTYEYRLKSDDTLVLSIESSSSQNSKLSDEAIQAIIDSIDIEIYKYMQN